MIKKLIVLSFTFSFAALVPLAEAKNVLGDVKFAESPFQACQNKAMLKKSDYAKNPEFWDRAIKECGAEVQVIPDNGFLNTLLFKLGEGDENKNSTEFLNLVGKRALNYVEMNNKVTEVLIHCAKNDKDWFAEKLSQASGHEKILYNMSTCPKLLNSVRGTLDRIRPEMRQMVLLSGYQDAGAQFEKPEAVNNVNRYMMAYPGIVIPKMDRATDVEAQAAAAQFDRDSKEIDAEFLKMMKERKAHYDRMVKEDGGRDFRARQAFPNLAQYKEETRANNVEYRKFQMQKRQDKFLEYRQRYMQLLAKAPIFAYLGKSPASNEDIAAAAEKVLNNGKEEHNYIVEKMAKAKADAARFRDEQEAARAMIDFMKYGPVVNEMVKENPLHCKTATGLANYIANSELRNNVGLMAGMVGGVGYMAFRGSALVAGTALAGFSNAALTTFAAMPFAAVMYTRDYNNYAEAERRTFNVIETEVTGKSIATIEDYEAARDAWTMSIALAGTGIDFWGMGLTKGGVLLGTAYAAGKIGAKPAARAATVKVLKSKGMKDAEITALLKDLEGANAAKASRAAVTMIEKVGLDKNEIRLVRMLGERGFLNPRHNKAFQAAFEKRMKVKDVKERARIAKEAMDVLEKVNPAKLNDVNRPQVLEALMAGAAFGVREPQRLAGILNDWDQGLDGLAKTFDLASQKLKVKKIANIKSVEARQAAAFDSALDDLMEQNPEFRTMSKADRQAAKSQMNVCGIGK